jgi:hypothetical protein
MKAARIVMHEAGTGSMRTSILCCILVLLSWYCLLRDQKTTHGCKDGWRRSKWWNAWWSPGSGMVLLAIYPVHLDLVTTHVCSSSLSSMRGENGRNEQSRSQNNTSPQASHDSSSFAMVMGSVSTGIGCFVFGWLRLRPRLFFRRRKSEFFLLAQASALPFWPSKSMLVRPGSNVKFFFTWKKNRLDKSRTNASSGWCWVEAYRMLSYDPAFEMHHLVLQLQ